MREKFMFFANFKETADKLPDDLRLKFYDAITDYVFNGVESDDPIISALVTAIKFSLDKVDGRANNGGNHNPTGVNQYKIKQDKEVNSVKVGQFRSIPLETETETRNKEKESLKKKVATASTFKKPTLEEVKAYCEERGNVVDPERWMDYYTANGWKVGRNPMKDWKATVRTWEKGEQRKPVESVGTETVLVEDGKFFIDDTMPEYRENCQKLTEEEVEKAWKWIMEHFDGKTVSVDFVNRILKKFDTSEQFRQAQGF